MATDAPKTRAIILTIVSTLAILILGLASKRILTGMKAKPDRKPVPERLRAVDVELATPTEFTIQLSGDGVAKPAKSVNLVPQLSAKIVEVNPNLRPGGLIKKDEILLKLDPRDTDIAVIRRKAELSRSKARLRALSVERRGASVSLSESKKSVKLSEKLVERDETLSDQGHLAGAATDRSRLELSQRLQNLNNARTHAGSIPHQLRQARAEVTIAEQALAQAELNASRTTLLAEFDLQVASGRVEAGDFVTAGRSIAQLQATEALELAVSFSIDDLHWLAKTNTKVPESRDQWIALLVGHDVTISRKTANDGEMTWTGHIDRIGAGLEAQSHMIEVFVIVKSPIATQDEAQTPLLPGMFCQVQIKGRTLQDVVVLPRKALPKPNTVYVAKPDNTLAEKEISLAYVGDEFVAIKSGLKSSDRIIINPLVDAVPKMKLSIRGETNKSGEDKVR